MEYKNVKATGHTGALKWRFSGNTLTISGDGEIPEYDDSDIYITRECRDEKVRSPWYIYRKMIKKIVFKGAISMKGDEVFYSDYRLSSVSFVPHFKDNTLNINDIIRRAFHGFTESDCWHFDCWFSWQIPQMLKQVSYRRCDKQTVDRIIFCFSEMMRPPSEINETQKMKAYREKMKNEGLELFCKHFRDKMTSYYRLTILFVGVQNKKYYFCKSKLIRR